VRLKDMKLTKYIHSCILLEENGEKLLIDPGIFTFSQGVPVDTFSGVKTIVITHNHPDHIDLENVKAIVSMGGATIVANKELEKVLRDAGVETTFITGNEYKTENFTIEGIEAAHEKILSQSIPENYAYRINGTVLAVGDSFAPRLRELTGIQTLMLPVMAPWNTELDVFDFAKAIAPKKIIPVHDGYAKEFFLKARYDNYKKNFEKEGIEFVSLSNSGDSTEI
jgi:L-ascorbate metabolism protein UlaG (beta-lactamase superfamily)